MAERKMTVQKVIRHGNSLAVVLSREDAEELGLEVGSLVGIERTMDHLVLRPVTAVPALSKARRAQLDAITERFRPALKKLAE